jgi:hypothetical protein
VALNCGMGSRSLKALVNAPRRRYVIHADLRYSFNDGSYVGCRDFVQSALHGAPPDRIPEISTRREVAAGGWRTVLDSARLGGIVNFSLQDFDRMFGHYVFVLLVEPDNRAPCVPGFVDFRIGSMFLLGIGSKKRPHTPCPISCAVLRDRRCCRSGLGV